MGKIIGPLSNIYILSIAEKLNVVVIQSAADGT